MPVKEADRQSMDRAIYHVSVGVRDMRKARTFYEAALAPLGCRLLCDFKDENGADASLGWGKSFPEFWVDFPLDGRDATVSNGAHIAFFAPDKLSVERFYNAALSAGGRDDGSPSYREYQPGYYAAFVRDPDGNKIEAVWLDFEKEGTSLA
jgi:catechol 2,3-dioxygenase-like lactoylglutathione lyase family enzyme